MLRRHLLTLPLIAACGRAQQSSASDPLAAAGRKYFSDVRLLTQNGDSVRLYSDLLHARVVVINAFFASCTGSCPMMAGTLSALQNRLGDHLGKDVFLLSFSVDPETDTPAQLQAYAERFHAKPGWLFLTGTKENVDFALSGSGRRSTRRKTI